MCLATSQTDLKRLDNRRVPTNKGGRDPGRNSSSYHQSDCLRKIHCVLCPPNIHVPIIALPPPDVSDAADCSHVDTSLNQPQSPSLHQLFPHPSSTAAENLVSRRVLATCHRLTSGAPWMAAVCGVTGGVAERRQGRGDSFPPPMCSSLLPPSISAMSSEVGHPGSPSQPSPARALLRMSSCRGGGEKRSRGESTCTVCGGDLSGKVGGEEKGL